MRAYLVDNQDTVVSNDFFIINDNFDEIEAMALKSLTPVAIRWERDSDGQVAYWSPSGACFNPHWYTKLQNYLLRDIPLELWQKAKHVAVDRGVSLRDLILAGLRKEIE